MAAAVTASGKRMWVRDAIYLDKRSGTVKAGGQERLGGELSIVQASGVARVGDRRLVTVTVLSVLSAVGNLWVGVNKDGKDLPPTLVLPAKDMAIPLLQEQVKVLGRQVAKLDAALAIQTEKVVRAEALAGLSETHIASLQTVIKSNDAAHSAAMRERELRARALVLRASSRIGVRVAESVKRSVAAMVGEAVPAFGVGVIVTTTALEVKDACTNLQDIYELNAAFAPDLSDEENRDHVCGITVPTVEELKRGALSRLDSIGKTLQDTLPEWAGGDALVKSD